MKAEYLQKVANKHKQISFEPFPWKVPTSVFEQTSQHRKMKRPVDNWRTAIYFLFDGYHKEYEK